MEIRQKSNSASVCYKGEVKVQCSLTIFLPFSSQLLHLFNQLKTEILQSHMMEKTFVLIQELLTAAEKSFNLKKYFWKVGVNIHQNKLLNC